MYKFYHNYDVVGKLYFSVLNHFSQSWSLTQNTIIPKFAYSIANQMSNNTNI